MTLLMAASKHKQARMVKWLLGRNADVNQKNETQTVKEVICTFTGGYIVCETILKNNMDINARVVPIYLSHLLPAGGRVNGAHDCC